MIVELIAGLLAVICLLVVGPNVYAISVFLMICALLVVFLVDLDWMIIPDEIVLFLAAFGIGLNAIGLARGQVGELVVFNEYVESQIWTLSLPSSLVGICVGAGLFLLMGWVAERAFRRPSLGFGDVKLAAAMGALLGPGYQFIAFFLYSIFIGAAVGLLLLLLRRHRGGAQMPFGPMLAVSAAAMLLFPQELTGLIMRFYM
jgi:prepilin signal peptidase PulO-like enzyme (type II secretory pathway)